MINPARMKDEFLDLVSISSLSRREGAIARRLETTLKAMGARVEVDDAGEKVGGETGNLLARFAGTKPGATPFLLSGHMDTVGPAEKIHVRVEGDIVRSDGTTVLGGDDKAGIGAILEAIRVLREQKIPHGDIEVVLSICEETGLLGAKHFDTGRLTARRGLVLDVDGVCELITRAPAANRLSVTVTGLEAHAGVCPERGMSAIQIASEAIAGMKLGRMDAETTANLGVIEGGLSTNIVPARVSIRGPRAPGARGHEGRAPVRAAGRPRTGAHRGASYRGCPQARPRLQDARHRGRLGRQRLQHARARDRQPRLRHARHPHGERVGGPQGPVHDGSTRAGDAEAPRRPDRAAASRSRLR